MIHLPKNGENIVNAFFYALLYSPFFKKFNKTSPCCNYYEILNIF